jgi:hypothetical protein
MPNEQVDKRGYAFTATSIEGLQVTWLDGTPGVIRHRRIERQTPNPDTFLATVQIDGPLAAVRGFLSIGGDVIRYDNSQGDVENALRAYCIRTAPRDGFFLRAEATAKRPGIVFVEMPVRKRPIC